MNKLTAEEVRLLIAGLSGNRTIREEKYLAALEIALASMKAEPVHQFIVNNPDHDGYVEWADCNPDYYSKEPSDRRRILYTAPPVPALKLTEEQKNAIAHSAHFRCVQIRGSFYNAAEFAIKDVLRLNGVTE